VNSKISLASIRGQDRILEGVEMIPSPLDGETFEFLLDEIAELLYVETCQHKKVSSSSTDLRFENQFEPKEIIFQ
jgi:hypothetical protein